jgi:hypothetical protein
LPHLPAKPRLYLKTTKAIQSGFEGTPESPDRMPEKSGPSLGIHISLDTFWRFSDSFLETGCGIGG